MPKSGIAGSWGRLIPIFLRNSHNDFQNGCTSLHSHQKWRNIPLISHLLQHKLSSVFLILSILTGVRWYLKVVLICIYAFLWWLRMLNNFLKYLLAIWDSSVENSLLSSMPHFFKLGYLEIWCLISWVLYIFWRSILCLMWD